MRGEEENWMTIRLDLMPWHGNVTALSVHCDLVQRSAMQCSKKQCCHVFSSAALLGPHHGNAPMWARLLAEMAGTDGGVCNLSVNVPATT